MTSELTEQRLDRWLWHARFIKSRSLAAKMIEEGLVRLNRARVVKSSTCVKCGDVLTLTLHEHVRIIEILAIADHRGPAPEAQLLYKEHKA